MNVPDGLELTLVEAPRFDTIDSLATGGLEALRVTVRVGSESDACSFLASVPWSSACLRAEILLLCYLDDMTLRAEAFASWALLLGCFLLSGQEFYLYPASFLLIGPVLCT